MNYKIKKLKINICKREFILWKSQFSPDTKKQQEIKLEKYKLTYEYINYGLSKTWVTKILNITIKSYKE